MGFSTFACLLAALSLSLFSLLMDPKGEARHPAARRGNLGEEVSSSSPVLFYQPCVRVPGFFLLLDSVFAFI